MHLRLEYAVDKAVSLCYLSAPTVLGLSFQGFGMPCTCSWMFYKFVQEFYGLLETRGFAPLEFGEVGFSLG